MESVRRVVEARRSKRAPEPEPIDARPRQTSASAASWRAASTPHAHGVQNTAKLAVPRFAFGFVGVVLINSLRLLPPSVTGVTTEIDTIPLAMAMAALGLSTHLGAIRKAGVKPLLLAASRCRARRLPTLVRKQRR